MSYELNQENDGVKYVNIYSMGKTQLGKLLSNFYPFRFTQMGVLFANIEALWVYLGIDPSNPNRDSVCMMNGSNAKKAGKKLRDGIYRDPNFEKKILAAVKVKLEYYAKKHPEVFLNHADLPLEHYYVYGSKIYDQKADYQWLVDGVSTIRTEITERLKQARQTAA